MIEKAILLFLGIWAIATVFYQFKATADFVGRWNYFSLIPKWTFFAPRPKTTDYLLCYQDRYGTPARDSEPVAIEFRQKGAFWPVFRFLWNPNKRNTKAIVDIAGFILSYAAANRSRIAKNALALELYVPYILLLNFVSYYAPPLQPNSKRRFLVFKTFGYCESHSPVKILESHFHRIES